MAASTYSEFSYILERKKNTDTFLFLFYKKKKEGDRIQYIQFY